MSEVLRKQLTYRVDSVLARRNSLRWQEAEALLKVKNVRARYIPEKIPAGLEQFATAVGIKDVRFAPLPVRGRLVREGHYLVVEIDEQLPHLERRFVLAHEIAHIILEGVEPQRLSNHQDRSLSERDYRRVENLCDEAAKEILVPVQLLRSIVDGTRASLELLLTLARKAQVRPEVVASQILRAREWDCSIFWWQYVRDRWMAVQSLPFRSQGDLVWLDIEDASRSIVERAKREQRLVCGSISLLESETRQQHKVAEALPDGEGSVLLMILLG